jgi:hypothetical protein
VQADAEPVLAFGPQELKRLKAFPAAKTARRKTHSLLNDADLIKEEKSGKSLRSFCRRVTQGTAQFANGEGKTDKKRDMRRRQIGNEFRLFTPKRLKRQIHGAKDGNEPDDEEQAAAEQE